MIQLTDLTLFQEKKTLSTTELMDRHKASLLYARHLNKNIQATIVKGLNVNNNIHLQDGSVKYFFLKSSYLFYFRALTLLLRSKPNIVLLHGLRYFPWIILFRLVLPSFVKFAFQHHAEKVPKGMKRTMLKRFFNLTEGVLFNSRQQANGWKGLIDERKLYVIPEGTTDFSCSNFSRAKHSYIWVGRLNDNKDPLSLLNAFERFLHDHPLATLLLVFKSDALTKIVKQKIDSSQLLKSSVSLMEDVPNNKMEVLYNKSRFFISTSHYESGGYSFIESLACGCIPIATNIAAFNEHLANLNMTGFNPRDEEGLYNCLVHSTHYESEMHMKVSQYFTDQLSPDALGKRMGEICLALNER